MLFQNPLNGRVPSVTRNHNSKAILMSCKIQQFFFGLDVKASVSSVHYIINILLPYLTCFLSPLFILHFSQIVFKERHSLDDRLLSKLPKKDKNE